MHLPSEFTPPDGTEVLIGILVAYGATMQDHLRGLIRTWLQEDRVHIRMAGYPSGLGLNRLGTSKLKALLGDEGIEGHVLRLEWSRPIAVL